MRTFLLSRRVNGVNIEAEKEYGVISVGATFNPFLTNLGPLLPLDEAVAYRTVFVIVSGADGRAAETLLEPAK